VALTIGSFDGVHVGHQEVLRRLRAAAARERVPAALITLDPHPRCVLDPENCPQSITTLGEKLALIEAQGVEEAIVVEFNREVAALGPDEFMARLRAAMEPRVLVVGFDFAFGRGRQGSRAWLEQNGYRVEEVPPYRLQGEELHSSDVRRLVTLGEIGDANRLLGREFSMSGLVQPGDRIGQTIGFPTVNIAVEPHKLIPKRGAYAGRAALPDGLRRAALSVGYRPTLDGKELKVEGYILDFEGDLYQHPVELRFVARLHDDIKFPSLEALVAQIARDVEETRRLVRFD